MCAVNIDRKENVLVIESLSDGVLTIQFNHRHYNNPFSDSMQDAVINSLQSAEENSNVKAIILTGGVGRSFSVGGDFNEVKTLQGGQEVDLWIDRITKMYTACLRVSKPTIAAVDNYAIGIGFQLALTCDYRIMTERGKFIMPELKHGIACTLGQCMLEKSLGRNAMLEIIYECEAIPLQKCFDYRLINKISSPDKLLEDSHLLAKRLASYPEVAFRKTKKVVNESYVEQLITVTEQTKLAHRMTFGDGRAQQFMRKVVGETV
ncbi:enoyl-CoA hydratase/isomerase family protein [Pelosinus fermentans]|uniref:Enoyl-CoA hydratase/isomerase n=1 Tax=Pelosinus fermentans JBW45 TaxID=1192197 RepID=I8TV45_9FIRM|nr:enoyl-CoA hydratase/isomerase family protein [Pelosinus fermentans]AJQ26591.1 Enoyl-CoA hydratase/isomerase [Pelosinus fermentans JBW45]